MYFLFLLMSLIPAIPILIWVHRCKESPTRDRKTAWHMILWVLLGIVVCTLIAEIPIEPPLSLDYIGENLVYGIFCVGVPEEATKLGAVLLATRLLPGFWKSPHLIPCVLFTCTVFAVIENALYMMEADMATAIMRSVTAVFAHTTYGLLAILLILALQGRSKWLIAIGLVFGGSIHGMDNFILFNLNLLPEEHPFPLLFIFVVWPAIVVVNILIIVRMTKIYRISISGQDTGQSPTIMGGGLQP